MHILKKIAIGLAAFYLFLLAFDFLWIRVVGQTPQQSITMVSYSNITAASKLDGCDPTPNPCIDNRSAFTRESSQSSFRAFGTGSWSVTMEYADVTPGPVWTSFGSTAVVNNSGPSSGIGYGIGPGNITKPYHDFIRFVITGNATIMNYSGTRQFWWLPSVASIAFPLTANQGGTYGAFYVDQLGSPLSTVCSTASGLGLTVLVTQAWNSQPTEDLHTCNLVFTSSGLIKAAASAAITVNGNFLCPTYQQCFDVTTNSGASLVISGSAPPINPNWFGADWTGTNDSLGAFNAAYAASVNISVVPGTYKLSNTFTMSSATSSLSCANPANTILEYAGSSDINSLVYVTGSNSNGGLVQGCGLKGNQHITLGLLDIDTVAGDTARRIQCYAIIASIGTAPNACAYVINGNTNTLEDIGCSGGQEFVNGIVYVAEFNDVLIRPKMEGIVNNGIWGFSGSGLTETGGTSEGNGVGVVMLMQSSTFNGLDLESNGRISAATTSSVGGGCLITYTQSAAFTLPANLKILISGASPSGYNVSYLPITVIDSTHFSVTTATSCPGAYVSGGFTGLDFFDYGFGNIYQNAAGGFIFQPSAHDDVLEASGVANLNIISGASGIAVRDSAINGLTAISDNGTCTIFKHNWTVNGGAFFPDQDGCNAGFSVRGGINRMVEVAATNITAATCAGSPGVITYTAAGYALSPGFFVTITGASPSGYNVTTLPINVIDANTFSVTTATSCPSAWVSGGATGPASANNALVVEPSNDALGGLGELGSCPATETGNDVLAIGLYLTGHTLQAGANSLNYCGIQAVGILTPYFGNIGTARTASDMFLEFTRDISVGSAWIIRTPASAAF